MADRIVQIVESGTAYVPRVEVTLTRGAVSETLTPTSYRLTQDIRRAMRWDGDLTFRLADGDPLYPTGRGDLLANFGTVATVRLGVEDEDGVPLWRPWGVYRVLTSDVDGGTITLGLTDIAYRVAAYRLEHPLTFPAGTDLAQIVRQVWIDRTGEMPDLDDTGRTIQSSRTLGLDPQTDPWREMGDIIDGFALRLTTSVTGQPEIVPVDTVGTARQLRRDGLQAAFDTEPANVIVVTSEPEDPDEEPLRVVVMDDDENSPTWAGDVPGQSPYGRVTRYFSSPLMTDTAQMWQAGRSLLDREKGAGASWNIRAPWDPTLHSGATVEVVTRDGRLLTLLTDEVSIGPSGVDLTARPAAGD